MKPFDYTTAKFFCPECREPLKYVGYTAFNCYHCGRGWGIHRLLSLQEAKEEHKPTPLHEDEYL